jgi:hypothetical protein
MRTLIALLAAAALSLPAAAQQTDTRQGPEKSQGSQQKAQGLGTDRDAAGSQRATNQDRGRRGGEMDRAGRATDRQAGRGQRAGRQLRGRRGYYERGRRVYGGYDRGSSDFYGGYSGGRRVYSRNCPRYIYINGRRVFNERCLGYRSGRRAYFGGYDRGPRYSYSRERGRAYFGRRTSVRESERNRGGERAGINERRGARGGQESGQQGLASGSQGNRASRSARSRSGTPTQTESQPGTR